MLLAQPGKFTFYQYGFDTNKQLNQEKEAIPMDIIKEQIAMKQKPGTIKLYILKAGTGSGKSSYFVNELLQLCNGKKMLCTLPKKVLCVDQMRSLPQYYPHLIPGLNIGYKVGGNDQFLPGFPQSCTFMTTQILTNYIRAEKWDEIFGHSFIVIDEVHSMDEAMIETLYFVKYFLTRFNDDPRCPLFICMSATINIEKFTKYFNMNRNLQWYDVGLLATTSMRFGREEFYFSKSKDSLFARLFESLTFIQQYYKENNIPEQEYKDILIFSKNKIGIQDITTELQKFKFDFPTIIIPYMSADQAQKTQNWTNFFTKMPGIVKIIVSTNLLESGANIENLYTVIDTAIRFTNIYNNIQKQNIMISLPISGSTRIQRQGRVGRLSKGIYIGLYPKDRVFEEDDINPLLVKPNIFQTIFLYLSYQLEKINSVQDFLNRDVRVNIQNIQLIEPISADIVLNSYHMFIRLGLIKRNGEMTILLFQLIKQKYDGFVKWICMYYGCSPFETVLIQYIITKPFTMSPKKKLTKQQQFETIINFNFDGLKQDEVLDFYEYVYDVFSFDGMYRQIPHNIYGYQKVFKILSE